MVVLAGCGTAPGPAGQVAMVSLPAGTVLAAEPGGKAVVRPGTNLGVVVERRDGQARVVAADGSVGWTGGLEPVAGAVRVECPGENFQMFGASPDVVSPEAGEMRQATAREGDLLGAAQKMYPATQQQLLAPERLRVMLPVVQLKCGVEGYAPLDWVWLAYDAPKLEGIAGLVRRPFLGPFVSALQAAAPAAGSAAVVFLEDKLEKQALPEGFTEVHGYYRDPAGSGKTLTIYGNGAARLYRFTQPEVSLLLPKYAPYPLRVEVREGKWLVEVVSIFGDGAYSTLFEVDLRGEVSFAALSRSSGEESEDVEAAWGWLNGKVWTARRVAGKVMLSGFPRLWLAEVGDALEAGASLFPVAEGGWVAAVPYADEKAARGEKVRQYP